jgi:hypothetical protein
MSTMMMTRPRAGGYLAPETPWSPDFPEPSSGLDARARLKVLGAEIQDIQRQLTDHADEAGGFVDADGWEWQKRAKRAYRYKVRQTARLKAWLAVHPDQAHTPRSAPGTGAFTAVGAQVWQQVRHYRYLLHRVLEEGTCPAELRDAIAASLAGGQEEP